MDDSTPDRIRQLRRHQATPEYIPHDEPMRILPRRMYEHNGLGDLPEWLKPADQKLRDMFENPWNLPEKWHHKDHAPQPKFPAPQMQEAPAEGDPFNTPMWHAGVPSMRPRQG